MTPRYDICWLTLIGMPSTEMSTLPVMPTSFKPRAVTTTSQSTSVPLASRTPEHVKALRADVTMEALPSRSALKNSPSASADTRCRHGSYEGVRCGRSCSALSPSLGAASHQKMRRAKDGHAMQKV
eukprot:scaffold235276_cov33-Tisochrysis_lutea.AAC.1